MIFLLTIGYSTSKNYRSVSKRRLPELSIVRTFVTQGLTPSRRPTGRRFAFGLKEVSEKDPQRSHESLALSRFPSDFNAGRRTEITANARAAPLPEIGEGDARGFSVKAAEVARTVPAH